MANNIVMYDMLISCPGDVENVVEVVKEVIENFNQQFIDTLGIGIRVRYWKKSAYAQSGGNPQELLNKQFVEKCDLAIAVFKTRFGTPTDRYGSGSEEEIEIMLNAGKQVFMFFDESPIEHDKIDISQLKKVRDFKAKYQKQKKGILWTYKSIEEFRNTLNAHITRYFLTNQTMQEMKNSRSSDLTIRSYFQGRIYNNAILTKFDMGKFVKSNEILDKIKEMFERISQYKMTRYDSYNDVLLLEKQVELPEDVKEWVKLFADKQGYTINENFFDLGGLKESVISASVLYGGRDLIGTDDEILKYNELIELRDEIRKLIGHVQVENYYSDLIGIQFIVCNDGTQYDEDIDIELHLSKKAIMKHNDLKVPNEQLDDDWCFEDIFEISACKDFDDYTSTLKRSQSYYPVDTPLPLFTNIDYEEEYKETLDDIFDYAIFEDGDNMIVKVHMDYLKQHNRVAFPTWIFFRRMEKYPDIEYRIISQKRAEIIRDKLKIEIRNIE